MIIEYLMTVDFKRPTKANTILIPVGGADSRQARFILMDGNAPLDMDDFSYGTIAIAKPDGSVINDTVTAVTNDDDDVINQITYLFPNDVTNETGLTTMVITLYGESGSILRSFNLYANVRNGLYEDNEDSDEDSMIGLRDLLERAADAIEQMEDMTSQTALPNPYPIQITVNGITYSYNGEERIQIDLSSLAHIGTTSEVDLITAMS